MGVEGRGTWDKANCQDGSPRDCEEGAGEEKQHAMHVGWSLPQMESSSVCLPAPPQMVETEQIGREEWPVPSPLLSLFNTLRSLGFFLPKSKRIFPPAQVPARRGNAFPAQSSATALACPCAHGAQAKGSLAERVGLARGLPGPPPGGPRAPGSEPGSAGAHKLVTECHLGRQV